MGNFSRPRGHTLWLLLLALLPTMTSAGLSITNGSALTASADASASFSRPANARPPRSERQPEPARASAVSGDVSHISGATGRKLPLTENTPIRVGDEVLSGNGSAAITLADGSKLRLSPDSRLMFNRLDRYSNSKAPNTRLRLQKGAVHTRVQPITEEGGRFEIATPSAVAAVRGTAFAMQTSDNGSSVQVTEGVVDFGPPGKARQIPAGYGAVLSTDSNEGLRIGQLPPAPTISPMPDVLTSLPAALDWQYQWQARYRLDIFEEGTGTWVRSREVSDKDYHLSDLNNGRYEIHLAALNSQGIAGMPDTATVEVSIQARKPVLVAPPDGGSVNDDKPQFRWQLTGNNEVARVEIAETDSFNELVATSAWAPEGRAQPSRALSPGQYYWRVVSEAGGNTVATSDTRKLVINGTLPPVKIISINYLDNQVRIYWEKVDTATGYRLQLAEEPGFRNIIKEADIDDTTAALRLIPGRRYFVRVKALSDGPLASRWGPGRELYLE